MYLKRLFVLLTILVNSSIYSQVIHIEDHDSLIYSRVLNNPNYIPWFQSEVVLTTANDHPVIHLKQIFRTRNKKTFEIKYTSFVNDGSFELPRDLSFNIGIPISEEIAFKERKLVVDKRYLKLFEGEEPTLVTIKAYMDTPKRHVLNVEFGLGHVKQHDKILLYRSPNNSLDTIINLVRQSSSTLELGLSYNISRSNIIKTKTKYYPSWNNSKIYFYFTRSIRQRILHVQKVGGEYGVESIITSGFTPAKFNPNGWRAGWDWNISQRKKFISLCVGFELVNYPQYKSKGKYYTYGTLALAKVGISFNNDILDKSWYNSWNNKLLINNKHK